MGQNVQQNHTWPDYIQEPQLEQRLREQLNEGCRLARELDERLRLIPEGKLLEMGPTALVQQGDSAPASQDSRLKGSLAMAAAEVVGAFNEAVKLLLQSSRHNVHMVPELSANFSAATSPPQALRSSSPNVPALVGKHTGSSTEPLSVPSCLFMKSPPLSPRAFLTPRNSPLKQGAQSTASPPYLIPSPLLSATTSEMSEGSPHERPAHPQLNDLSADEAATTANKTELLCRKRKLLPKMTLKMAAGSVESAESNTPPDDGHTWRKYGQKAIHGALYPRGYYRCTHKTDMGCPAVKQVQRCDEEQLLFDVVYKGYHTCRSVELEKNYWPLAFPQGLFNLLNFPSIGSTSSAHALTRFLNISSSTAPSGGGGSAVASLMLANYQDTGCTLLSARQDCDVSSLSSSAALSLGCSAGPADNQLAPSSGKLDLSRVSTDYSGAAAVSAADLLQQKQLYVGGDQLSVRYAQEQRKALNPLETWSSFENSTESNRPEVSCKGPFMEGPYVSSTVGAANEKLIRGNEIPTQILQGVLVESKVAYSDVQTYGVSSHEQSRDATIMSTSPSSNVSIDVRSPTHHFAAVAAGSGLIDEDMDNDNLLSDYFKSLN